MRKFPYLHEVFSLVYPLSSFCIHNLKTVFYPPYTCLVSLSFFSFVTWYVLINRKHLPKCHILNVTFTSNGRVIERSGNAVACCWL